MPMHLWVLAGLFFSCIYLPVENFIHVYHEIWSYPPLISLFQLDLNPLQHISLRLHVLFISLFKNITHSVQSVIFMCAGVWSHPLGHGQPVTGHGTKEEWFSLSPQLSNANSSTVKGWGLMSSPPPQSMLEHWLARSLLLAFPWVT